MSLSKLVGQPLAKRFLFKALAKGAVGQSYLFVGPEGTGKTYAAVNLAKALNCRQPTPEGDACDACPSCRAIESGTSPDFRLIEAEGARIKIERTRALIAAMALRPDAGRRKVTVIRQADKLTLSAANNLLKVLEEPPAYGVIILTTANPAILPATVLSRCQTVPFRPASPAEVGQALIEQSGASPEDAAEAAALSGGILGQALGLLGSGQLANRRGLARRVVAGLGRAGLVARIDMAEELAQYGEERETLSELLGDVADVYRDALAYAVAPATRSMISRSEPEFLARVAQDYGPDRLRRALDLLSRALEALRRNGQPRLALEYALLNL